MDKYTESPGIENSVPHYTLTLSFIIACDSFVVVVCVPLVQAPPLISLWVQIASNVPAAVINKVHYHCYSCTVITSSLFCSPALITLPTTGWSGLQCVSVCPSVPLCVFNLREQEVKNGTLVCFLIVLSTGVFFFKSLSMSIWCSDDKLNGH